MNATKRPVIRWHLTSVERDRVASGEDVYLFYFPENERYSLEIAPEGTGTDETVSLLVEEPAPSGVYVRERNELGLLVEAVLDIALKNQRSAARFLIHDLLYKDFSRKYARLPASE